MSQAPSPRHHSAPFSLLTAVDRAALPPGAVDAYPLSTLQSGVVFEAVSASQPGLYHDVLTYRLRGPLDVPAFTRAVQDLVRLHPIFRTSFHLDGFTEPIQVVHGHVPTPLRVTDLRGLPAEEVSRRLAADAGSELTAGFRYGTADLVRVRVHLLTNDEYQYTLSYHDAAIDSTSVRIVHHDLFDAYFRLTAGGGDQRSGIPGPVRGDYRDFVAAEREALDSTGQAAFWRAALDGAEGTRIPRYADVPAGTPDRLAIHDVGLPDGFAGAVTAAAARLSVPVHTVLAAAHVKVLGVLSGRTDVLTGYEHSGRTDDPGAEWVAGLFLNTLPLRVDCRPGTWRELVAAVRAAELACQPHRRFPMAEIKRRSGIRGLLVETVLNVTPVTALEDLSRRYGFALPRADLNARTEFPLRAEFGHDERAGDLRFAIHHHADQFSQVQIDRIAGYYLSALRALTADPDARHDQASLLDPAETTLVTGGFCGRSRPLPAETFAEVFGRAAATWPDRIALAHRGQTLSYAELHAAAQAMGDRLHAHGLCAGDACALALPRGVRWAVAVLAVLLRGGVYVPLDPTHPPARIAAAATRAGVALLVTDAPGVAAIESELAGRTGGDRCHVIAHDAPAPASAGAQATGAGPVTRRPGDDAYILFTSGSTGEPKGARITHAGMLNHLLAKVDNLGLGPDDRIAQTASQGFDISVWQLLAAWTVGGRTVVYDTDAVTDARFFLERLTADGITVTELVPSYLDALLVEHARRPRPLSALRYGMVTGEPVPVPLVRRWFEQLGAPLVNAYGPTEAADDVTHMVLREPVQAHRVPVGTPIPNTGIHVVGPDGRHRPIGCYGEIVVTGTGVGRGYVNDPERTAEAFAPNTLDRRSALMYRTGDVGRWLPDGTLDCAGRLDSQVKLRGFRIELAEIEGAVAAMSGVDGVVAAVTPTGRLVAGYLGTASLEISQIRQELARVLPDYMLPDAVTAIERVPLGANGKVDRAALARQLAPAAERPGTAPAERPATRTEHAVAGLFARVLATPVDRIGLDDDFFEIGGHSLAAMKLAARSEGQFALRDIVTRPTVRSLAALLDSGRAAARPLLIPLITASAGAPALVCAPYAGGGAVNFLPLARKLAERAPDLAVYGIEPPGRTLTDPLQMTSGLDRAIETVADEVAAAGHRWVAVFGHCSGSILALLLARLLGERGVTVTRVFTAAKVLRTVEPGDYADDEFGRFSDEQVADWVRNTIGMAELDEMSGTEIADMAQAFRLDSTESNRILCQALRAPEHIRAGCPVTQVVALDDEITAGHAAAVGHWELFASDVTAATLPDGGHYFNRTRPAPLAALVAAELGLPGSPCPAGRAADPLTRGAGT